MCISHIYFFFLFIFQAVQGKLFGSKEIVALSCAWCHEVYHNKESCFNQSKIGEICTLGKSSLFYSTYIYCLIPSAYMHNTIILKSFNTIILQQMPSFHVTTILLIFRFIVMHKRHSY